MSTSKQWFMTADETRLSILSRDAADLDLQSYELNKLRHWVRQAQPNRPATARSGSPPRPLLERIDLRMRGDIRSPLKLQQTLTRAV